MTTKTESQLRKEMVKELQFWVAHNWADEKTACLFLIKNHDVIIRALQPKRKVKK